MLFSSYRVMAFRKPGTWVSLHGGTIMPRYDLDTRILADAPLAGLSYSITPLGGQPRPARRRSHTIIRGDSPFVKRNPQSA